MTITKYERYTVYQAVSIAIVALMVLIPVWYWAINGISERVGTAWGFTDVVSGFAAAILCIYLQGKKDDIPRHMR